jgi:hypothetical protein
MILTKLVLYEIYRGERTFSDDFEKWMYIERKQLFG